MVKKLLCFGEISWDQNYILRSLADLPTGDNLLAEKQGPGGCALNTAAILAGLGAPITLAGNYVGLDKHGLAIQKYLTQIGLNSAVVLRESKPTPLCQTQVAGSSGDRKFKLSHDGIQDYHPELLETLREALVGEEFSHIFIQPYLKEASRKLLEMVPTSSWIMSQDLESHSEFIDKLDCLQISLNEEQLLTPIEIMAQAKPYLRGRMKLLIITQGSVGVWVAKPEQEPSFLAAQKVSIIQDTTGCGDAFRAGFMWGQFHNYSLSSCLSLGQLFGAYKTQVLGSHFVQKIENIRVKKS